MHWKEIAAQFEITLSAKPPFLELSWKPSEPEIKTARRLLNFLETRRVLYHRGEMEYPDYCILSVLQIREFLTELLGDMRRKDGLPKAIRDMRAACVRFLDECPSPDAWEHIDEFDDKVEAALDKLRASFGFNIGLVAIMYRLDISDDLATILPPAPPADDG